jgi:tRNA A37 threonylcarbamoyladenosine synthetase subunit TsaC/SUA5/YrdC
LKAQGIQPDLVLNSGTLPPTPPSTILDLSTETVRKLRN